MPAIINKNESSSVFLKTGEHCIHSAAKNEFRRLSMIILDSMDDKVPTEMIEQLELLTDFLEHTDFNKLRASDDRYAGITEAVCILKRNKEGKPEITIAG